MEISCVAAMDHNRLIGADNNIPWHLPGDLAHFRELTLGHPIIMGRRTHESIGITLDDRLNIILTRNEDYLTFEDCEVTHTKEEALQEARNTGTDEAMIIGGEAIYEMFLPESDRLHLTVVHNTFDGTVYFPEFDVSEWTITDVEDHDADEENPHDYSFLTLEQNGEAAQDRPKSRFELPDFFSP